MNSGVRDGYRYFFSPLSPVVVRRVLPRGGVSHTPANYLNLQPRRGCFYWGDCRYPHVADCASLIVNMGLLRLQPLRGCASGGIAYARHHRRVISRRVLLQFASYADAFFGGGVVSVGYAIAHPRLNPVGILPPGSRPSDVHFAEGFRLPVRAYCIRP